MSQAEKFLTGREHREALTAERARRDWRCQRAFARDRFYILRALGSLSSELGYETPLDGHHRRRSRRAPRSTAAQAETGERRCCGISSPARGAQKQRGGQPDFGSRRHDALVRAKRCASTPIRRFCARPRRMLAESSPMPGRRRPPLQRNATIDAVASSVAVEAARRSPLRNCRRCFASPSLAGGFVEALRQNDGRYCARLAFAIAIAAVIDPPLTSSGRGRSRVAPRDCGLRRSTPLARCVKRLPTHCVRSFDVVLGADASADAAWSSLAAATRRRPPERQRVFTVTMPPEDGEPNVRLAACSRSTRRGSRNADPPRDRRRCLERERPDVHVDRPGRVRTRGGRACEPRMDRRSRAMARGARRDAARCPAVASPRRTVNRSRGTGAVRQHPADALVSAAEPFQVVMSRAAAVVGRHVRSSNDRGAIRASTRLAVAAISKSRGSRAPSPATDRTSRLSSGRRPRYRLHRRRRRHAHRAVHARPRRRPSCSCPDSLSGSPGREPVAARARWPPEAPPSSSRRDWLSIRRWLSIRASELLRRVRARGPTMRVLASNGSNLPVITVAAGRRRSAAAFRRALDAWRFRSERPRRLLSRFGRRRSPAWPASVFARRSAIDVTPPIVAPGETAAILVRVPAFRLERFAGCRPSGFFSRAGGRRARVRLWPGDEPDYLSRRTVQRAFGRGRSSSHGEGR
mgnify:CR=1 FL=1